MKLIIYDSNWALYRPLIERFLRTSWSIVSEANDLGWLRKQLADADAMIGLTLPPEARETAHKLRIFQFPGAGVIQCQTGDFPDGCELCNVFEHEVPVAEYVLMVILMHATRILHYSLRFRDGYWDGNGRAGGELHEEICGKKLGIVGLGHIGQAVAVRARSLGLRVEAIRRNPEAPMLPEVANALEAVAGTDNLCGLLARNDFVVIACPLNDHTRGWIGETELAHLQSHSLLINVARAEIIQEEPLYRALERRQFSAALDVWYRYPSTFDGTFPGSRLPLQRLANVMATPHFSGWTSAMIERRMRNIAENLDRLHRGEAPLRVVLTGTWKPVSSR